MKISPLKYAQALAIMLDVSEKTIIGNFLEVLKRRRQTKLLPKILKLFESQWLKRRGIIHVQVMYPKKFEASLEELKKSLAEKFGEKVRLDAVPSDEIIGGFLLRIDDTLIDASIEGNIKKLAAKLH